MSSPSPSKTGSGSSITSTISRRTARRSRVDWRSAVQIRSDAVTPSTPGVDATSSSPTPESAIAFANTGSANAKQIVNPSRRRTKPSASISSGKRFKTPSNRVSHSWAVSGPDRRPPRPANPADAGRPFHSRSNAFPFNQIPGTIVAWPDPCATNSNLTKRRSTGRFRPIDGVNDEEAEDSNCSPCNDDLAVGSRTGRGSGRPAQEQSRKARTDAGCHRRNDLWRRVVARLDSVHCPIGAEAIPEEL